MTRAFRSYFPFRLWFLMNVSFSERVVKRRLGRRDGLTPRPFGGARTADRRHNLIFFGIESFPRRIESLVTGVAGHYCGASTIDRELAGLTEGPERSSWQLVRANAQ